MRKGQPNLSRECMELITSKELLPRLISTHKQDAWFISLHLQDKSLLCWHTKATHTQARSSLVKLAACYWHEINNAEDICFDKFDVTSYLTLWIVFRTAASTVNLHMVMWCYSAHCTNHVYANVCVLQRKMTFSCMAQFHLASSLLEWK